MKTWIAISLTALVASCATPDQIAKQPVAGSFTSAMSAKKLAACVDHNAENRFFAGAFRSKVRDSGEEPIVVVVHANADYVSTVVEIRSTQSGSVALFRFGGASELDEKLSPGSVLKKYVTGCE